MENKGTILSYRPDIRVVDATIRDGGLVNDFRFTDEFVKNLYQANIKAGVDYMEFGYKASKDIFDEKDFGPWKFCNEEDIRRIVGDNDSDMKIAVMAVPAAVIQLSGYGTGFLKAWFLKILLRRGRDVSEDDYPATLVQIASEIAEIRHLTTEDVLRQTRDNLWRFIHSC